MTTKLEYKVVEVRSDELEETLNRYAKEGWELFTIHEIMGRIRLIFERHA